MDGNRQTKGRPGERLNIILTGCPFYMMLKLSGVGCVTTLPDTKQGMSHYL